MSEYVFKVYGLTEENFKNRVEQLSQGISIDYKIVADGLDIKFMFTPLGPISNEIDLFVKNFLSAFDENIYALRDVSLKEQLVDILKLNGYKISVAESFTGGNVAATIISVAGASSVFYEGIVAYNEKAKVERLGVNLQSLQKFKPVSSVVAEEMAVGLIKGGNCDISISTTGLAGPDGDGSGMPVGLCYIGLACFGEVHTYKFMFSGNRNDVIEQGVGFALLKAIKCLTLQINR